MATLKLPPGCVKEDVLRGVGKDLVWIDEEGAPHIIRKWRKETNRMDLKELYKALKGAQSCMSNGFACQLCPYNGPRRECSEEMRDDLERAVEQVQKALEGENG